MTAMARGIEETMSKVGWFCPPTLRSGGFVLPSIPLCCLTFIDHYPHVVAGDALYIFACTIYVPGVL